MTKIEWVKKDGEQGVTWNPTTGCDKVSLGCKNCYAERMAKRLKGMGKPRYKDGFKLTLHEDLIERPLHWRKPRMVFVNSMSDLFHEDVPFEFIDKVFAVMALCPQHTFQVLTKRAERMREYIATAARLGAITPRMNELCIGPCVHSIQTEPWPLPNVWLGVSVEDQSQLDRVKALKGTPAALRFISYEPALGPLDIRTENKGIDWLIVGGESGPGARFFDLQWVRDTLCWWRGSALKVFVKQLGANPWQDGKPLKLKSPKGNDPSEWPEDLRVREMPEATQ